MRVLHRPVSGAMCAFGMAAAFFAARSLQENVTNAQVAFGEGPTFNGRWCMIDGNDADRSPSTMNHQPSTMSHPASAPVAIPAYTITTLTLTGGATTKLAAINR